MKKKFTFVTGFFGAPIESTARAIAESTHAKLIFLDEEISKSDGRSIQRLCMMMGEHEYRNKEYETLAKILGGHVKASSPACDTKKALPQGSASASDTEAASIKGSVADDSETVVVCCGDGVLLDDMSRQLIEKHSLIIAGEDMTVDELWQNAKTIKDSYHAFMTLKDEQRKLHAFHALYQRQSVLYNKRSING